MAAGSNPEAQAAPPLRHAVVCGAGAVGSVCVDRLHALDPACVSVVASGARLERLRRDGLEVNGRRLPVRCLAAGDASRPAGLLLVAVKQHHLAAAIEDARAAVGEDTIVLSLLNGVTSEAALGRAFGEARVLPAFVVGTDAVREGDRTRYGRTGRIVFGARSNDPRDPRVVAVKALLDRAGLPNEVPADILREQWWKWMLNVGVNQVSAVLRAPYGAFALPEVQALTRDAALEAVAVARAEGVALAPEDVERIFPVIATLAAGGKTSMLQDVEAGRKTEVELFAETVLALGARHGVATPVNALLGRLLVAGERVAGVGGRGSVG